MFAQDLYLTPEDFDLRLERMDKSSLTLRSNFFKAYNTNDPDEALRRVRNLKGRADALGVDPTIFAADHARFRQDWDCCPEVVIGIEREAARHRALMAAGFTPMSLVEPRQAEYLIEPYLPLDAITILAGTAGMGKTWLALKWAAGISTGALTPDHKPGTVYYLTRENDPSIVLSPRLRKLGANLANIIIMADTPGNQPLVMNDPRLEALASTPGCQPALVVYDPIQSYLGRKVQMNSTDDVRPVMDGLAAFAAAHHCAVLLVSHMNKPSLAAGVASDRILGSGDFRNAARSIVFVGADPDDADTRVFAHNKNSLGPTGPSRRFSITDSGVEIMDECSLTAEDIIRPANKYGAAPGPAPTLRDRTCEIIMSAIGSKGWEDLDNIQAALTREGLKCGYTMYHARKTLGLCSHHLGNKQTFWYTPDTPTERFLAREQFQTPKSSQ